MLQMTFIEQELYEYATGSEMIGHHDATHDVLNMHIAVKALVEKQSLDLFFED